MTKKESGNNEAKSKLSVICPIAGTVTIILLYVGGSLYCVLNKCGIIEIGLGEIGDFVNPIIAGFALMLLYLAYKTQKEEMKNMTDNMRDQLAQVYNQAENAQEQLKLAKLDNQIQEFTHFSSLSEKHMDTMLYQIILYLGMTINSNQSNTAAREKKASPQEIDQFHEFAKDPSSFQYHRLDDEKSQEKSMYLVDTRKLRDSKNILENCSQSYLKVYESLLEKAKELDKNIEDITKKKSNYILLYNYFSFAEIKESIEKFKNFLDDENLANLFKRLKA